ncbi:branched-chain amino acid aminotransferase [Pacificimonas sp. ICDLI1SI03]
MTVEFTQLPGVKDAVAGFSLPQDLAFGQVAAPVMFSAEYSDGEWHDAQLEPYGPISIIPTARSLQFAESVFEGMKAYRAPGMAPHLFRPEVNCRRFAGSAERLGMPPVPEDLFMTGLAAVTQACADFVPTSSGASLYLRPVLFSTEAGFTVANSKSFRFMITASPSSAYTSGPMKVLIERKDVRAARGGIGYAKAGANYAAAMRATTNAVARGFSVALWLDPINNRTIEELSGMNFFAVIDGALHTPPIGDSIIAGVTRDSIIRLAKDAGIEVQERAMPIDELTADLESGRCRELFATGTAAIVVPIHMLGDADGNEWTPPETTICQQLRSELLDIQERRAPDRFDWLKIL